MGPVVHFKYTLDRHTGKIGVRVVKRGRAMRGGRRTWVTGVGRWGGVGRRGAKLGTRLRALRAVTLVAGMEGSGLAQIGRVTDGLNGCTITHGRDRGARDD